MTRAAPDGWHTLTPRIFVSDVAKMVEFLRHTFQATGAIEETRPSVIRIGDSLIMVSGTEFREAMPAFLYVYVDDVDAVHERALEAGATSLEEPQATPYGDRRSMIKDRWNNVWQIATRKEML